MTTTHDDELQAMIDKYFPKDKRHARGQAMLMKSEIKARELAAHIAENQHAKSIWLYEESYFDERINDLKSQQQENEDVV